MLMATRIFRSDLGCFRCSIKF